MKENNAWLKGGSINESGEISKMAKIISAKEKQRMAVARNGSWRKYRSNVTKRNRK
jgi:hypothetical protein